LKAKKNRSRYDNDIPSTYGSITAHHTNNPEAGFIRAYDDLEWSEYVIDLTMSAPSNQ
jgi:hypothetical protein